MTPTIRAALDAHCAALAGMPRVRTWAGRRADRVEGDASPRVMLVGQAPGQVEAAGGRPFAGRAGATLFRWLERAGVDEETARQRIYIAAITRCFPGASPSGRGDRVPSAAEQEACGAWLNDELRDHSTEARHSGGTAGDREVSAQPAPRPAHRSRARHCACRRCRDGDSAAASVGREQLDSSGRSPRAAGSRGRADRRVSSAGSMRSRARGALIAERGVIRGLLLVFALHFGRRPSERRSLVRRRQGEALLHGGVRSEHRVQRVFDDSDWLDRGAGWGDGRDVGREHRKGGLRPALRRRPERQGSDVGRRGPTGGEPALLHRTEP